MMSREGGLHDSDSLPVRISEVHEQIAKLLAVHATAGRNAPPIDVAWGWHVHRLSPRACMQGSRMLFGGIVTPAEGVGFAHAHLNPDKQVGSAPEIEPDAPHLHLAVMQQAGWHP